MTNNKLRSRREAASLDQARLASLAGVTQATVSRIESGAQTPSVAIALRLASTLGVSVEDLFGSEDLATEALGPALDRSPEYDQMA